MPLSSAAKQVHQEDHEGCNQKPEVIEPELYVRGGKPGAASPVLQQVLQLRQQPARLCWGGVASLALQRPFQQRFRGRGCVWLNSAPTSQRVRDRILVVLG